MTHQQLVTISNRKYTKLHSHTSLYLCENRQALDRALKTLIKYQHWFLCFYKYDAWIIEAAASLDTSGVWKLTPDV